VNGPPIGRRRFLAAAAAAPLLPMLDGCGRSTPWEAAAYRRPERSRVAVLAAGDYAGPLADTILQGLRQFPLQVVGKTVVLKPNLVEYDPAGVINTHPAVIAGAVEAFRSLGARHVLVAEGPGHRRDSEYLITASGLHARLAELRAPYVDLNHDDTRPLMLRSHFTRLTELHLPRTVLEADLLVSMPKMKTHHWAGVTLSLKNMFGVVPGLVYGWPKNVLHWAGIHESVCDINSTLPVPRFAIVDGIVGMEGNGPIQGDPKPAGVLVLGDDLVAVDATAARLMGVAPQKVKYIEQAGRFLGNADPERVVQAGEPVERLRKEFRVIESFQYLRQISG
jgi:uncharacterized protein (DUF362 family)